MELEKGLQRFLKDAIEEKAECTVEGSFPRLLTENEVTYLNEKLEEYNYLVNCFRCETCDAYSGGKEPFHIERVSIR